MPFDRGRLIADLEHDEGFEALLYDDATGNLVGKGSTLMGNPTVGIGWCPATQPLTHGQAVTICGWQIDDRVMALRASLPWFDSLDDVRARALINMSFQLGTHGVMQFRIMLNAMRVHSWGQAADAALDSAWARQTPKRAERVAAMIRTGLDQP